ncbi:hypothetical protein [Bacillus sp. 1P06AnD]
MLIGEFVKAMETTHDTIRHYIQLELLQPSFQGKRYRFADKEKRILRR